MKRLIFALLLIFSTMPVQSAIINIPDDYSEIQTAIDNASFFGDTILVAPGRYYENIRFYGKNVVLTSNYLFSNDPQDILNTIIDGSQYSHIDSAATVVYLDNETSQSELVGFVITGGKGALVFGPREGGGINVDNASPTIRNNIIVGNEAILSAHGKLRGGGGVNFKNSTSKLIGNIIMWNKGYNYCGGVLIQNASITANNNLIAYNDGGTLTGTWDGAGGIYFYQCFPACQINNNIIANNFANKYGGIFSLSNGRATLKNNIVRENISGITGSQITLNSTSTTLFPVSNSNIEGGYAGIDNIDDDPIWNERFELLATSTSIDIGDSLILFNDIEDALNPGMALLPALGTIRNDLGVYGGQTPLPLIPIPTFINPILSLTSSNVINYSESVSNLQPVNVIVTIKNDGIKLGIIDSVIANSSIQIDSNLQVDLLYEDSLNIAWSPQVIDDVVDTIKIFHNDPNTISPFEVIINYTPLGCCRNIRGNVDGDSLDNIDISDLVLLVDYMFTGGDEPVCFDEANIDGLGVIDISDLVILVSFMFQGGTQPTSCS